MDAKREIIKEIYAPVRKNFPRMKVKIRGLFETLSADLVDMQKYSSRGYKYILTVIDNFSKYAWAVPVKNKTGPEVAAAFQKVLSEGHPVKNIHVDEGTEFFNRHVKKLLKKYGNINLYHTFSGMKSAIVERFNRTLRHMMHPELAYRGHLRWTEILPDLVEKYNNTRHRTIGMTPLEATDPTKEKDILRRVYRKSKVVSRKKPKFAVGDFVRMSKNKLIFEKGYTANYTTEIYKIAKVKLSNPRTYLLKDLNGEDVEGRFYEAELAKTRFPDQYLVERVLRRKGKKLYVKWLGFDQRQWIDEKDVL